MSKLSLVCLTIAVCAIGSCFASPLMNRIEADGADKCKGLCKLCDCVGFYCGDECICECNNVNVDRNLNCVEKMQVSSENMKAPFEVLIQGSSSDRFVRSLMAAEESSASQKAGSTDSRLTFSVHQPETEQSKAEAPPKEETQPSCRAKDFMKKDEKKSTPETDKVEPKTIEGEDASPSATQPTLRSKRQSGDAPPESTLAEQTGAQTDAQGNAPMVGGPLGLLGPAIAARVGLGHLGVLGRGLRIHHAVGLHHALLPLRSALHHVPLIPLLGAANPNADGEPVGQENQNAQAMPSIDSAPPASQDFMNNANSMIAQRINTHIQNFNNNFQNRAPLFRQQMNPGMEGPTPAQPMREQSTF